MSADCLRPRHRVRKGWRDGIVPPIVQYGEHLSALLEEYPAPWRLSDPDINGHHDIYDAKDDQVILIGIPVVLEKGLVAAVNLAAAVRA